MWDSKKCGRRQSSSKQKHTVFFLYNKGKKKKKRNSALLNTFFIEGASWEAQRTKSIKRRLSTTKSWCRITRRCQNLDHRKFRPVGNPHEKIDTRRIPNSCLGLSLNQAWTQEEVKQNTWRTWVKHSLWNTITKSRQLGNNCWETPACSSRGRGPGSQQLQQQPPRQLLSDKQRVLCRPKGRGQTTWQGWSTSSQRFTVALKSPCSPTHSGSRQVRTKTHKGPPT